MFDPSGNLGALPAYVQIAEIISREISAGLLVAGDRLPPEREMAKQYGVAVGTLRKSLMRLREQGFIESIHGSGNYVRACDADTSLYAFFRLELQSGGGLPSAELLSLRTLNKPKNLPDFGACKVAHRFRRLRYLNKIPAALEEIWLDGSVAETVNKDQISESLYHYYKQCLDLVITRAEDRVSIANVPSWTVDQFPLSAGSPAGFVERFGWSREGACIEYSRNWFDPTRIRYVARLN